MPSDLWEPPAAVRTAGATGHDHRDRAAAEAAVTALYHAHALGLIRLAHIMLGDRPSAEDVVQDAFCGLYRRWPYLSDSGRALQYVRSSVLNGCRTVLRRARPRGQPGEAAPHISAEATVISGEERREIMRALRQPPGALALPPRGDHRLAQRAVV